MSMEIKVLKTEHCFDWKKSDAIAEALRQVPAGATIYGYEVGSKTDSQAARYRNIVLVDVIYGVETPKTVQHPWTNRLAHIEQRTPIELRASDLVWAVEKMGAHPLLTEAQTLVNRALMTLGAWTDEGEPGKIDLCYEPTPGDDVHEHYVPKGDAAGKRLKTRADTLAREVCQALWGGEHGWEDATDEQFDALVKNARKAFFRATRIDEKLLGK